MWGRGRSPNAVASSRPGWRSALVSRDGWSGTGKGSRRARPSAFFPLEVSAKVLTRRSVGRLRRSAYRVVLIGKGAEIVHYRVIGVLSALVVPARRRWWVRDGRCGGGSSAGVSCPGAARED